MKNSMQRQVVDNEPRPVKIYDVETKTVLMVCESHSEVERVTGIAKRNVKDYIGRKWRSYNNLLGKTICLR